MSPVAVSADRRFHRARVKPARRRGVWRRYGLVALKYGVTAAVVLMAGLRTASFLSSSPLLAIDRIEPVGNRRLTPEAVRTLVSGLRGENILFADLEQWRTTVLESAWVRDVSFRRSLPSTIEVHVQERTPIAIGRLGTRLFLVDDQGQVIDEFGPQYTDLDLPIVDGLESAKNADALDPSRIELATRLIASLKQKPAIAKRLSQVDVSDVHNATILLDDDAAELRVGESRFLERVESYLTLSTALHERVPQMDYVDLRFDGRVYVRPAMRTEKPAADADTRSAASRVKDARRR